jgi:hypothetical protein
LLNQIFLRCVAFGFHFLEVQIRLVVGMLGALFLVQQSFHGQQLLAAFISVNAESKRALRSFIDCHLLSVASLDAF